jgi:hypothetical protein
MPTTTPLLAGEHRVDVAVISSAAKVGAAKEAAKEAAAGAALAAAGAAAVPPSRSAEARSAASLAQQHMAAEPPKSLRSSRVSSLAAQLAVGRAPRCTDHGESCYMHVISFLFVLPPSINQFLGIET